MSRNPFVPSKNQYTEHGFGEGMFPDPGIDFSDNGIKSKFPVADPDRRRVLLDLFTSRRTDLSDPDVRDIPQNAQDVHPDYYTCGNTDRYGAGPPLIRSTKQPTFPRQKPPEPKFMERKW